MTLFIMVCFWRLGLFVIAWVVSYWFKFNPTFPYSDIYLLPSKLPQFIFSFANFDGVHYLGIAKNGYFAQYTQAFFPLYPILIKIIAWLVRDKQMIISGLVISMLAIYLAVIFFIKLLNLDYQSSQVKLTIWWLLIFPFSFFFAALYTEAIFFMLVISCFYFARKKHWVIVGLLGLLAAATRITGILLLPALLWEEHIYKLKTKNLKLKIRQQISLANVVHDLGNLVKHSLVSPITYLTPLGLVGYMAYLQYKFADWLYFWHAQPFFGGERGSSGLVLPIQVVWRYIKILISVSVASAQFWIAVWELGFFIGAVILLLIAHKQKVRLSYLIFSWLAILLPSFSGTLASMPRYILVAFPIYMVLANIKNQQLRIILSFISLVLLLLFTSLFVSGSWVA